MIRQAELHNLRRGACHGLHYSLHEPHRPLEGLIFEFVCTRIVPLF